MADTHKTRTIGTQASGYVKWGKVAWNDADPLDKTLIIHALESWYDPWAQCEMKYFVKEVPYTDDGEIDWENIEYKAVSIFD